MGDKTNKQHFVPQSHLRFFSYKVINEDKLTVFDKTKAKGYFFSDTVDNLACKRKMYEITNVEDNKWEIFFRKYENNLPYIYNALIINCKFSFNNDRVLGEYLVKKLSDIIIVQLLRTRKAKDYFYEKGVEISKDVINESKKIFGDKISDMQWSSINDTANDINFIYGIALEHLLSDNFIKKASHILMDKVWIVHKNLNYKLYPLVTSDNPVILFNFLNNHVGLGMNGIARKDVVIYYAINPELVIGIYPKTERNVIYDRCIDYMGDVNFSLFFAKLNIIQSTRHVFMNLKI